MRKVKLSDIIDYLIDEHKGSHRNVIANLLGDIENKDSKLSKVYAAMDKQYETTVDRLTSNIISKQRAPK